MQSKIVIVIAAYDRPYALKRLLGSIENANFEGYTDIPLIISIDHSGKADCNLLAEEFQWHYGLKRIIKYENNIGLRNHILACGDLTAEYENLIILEDDCFVSRNFYDYACQSLDFYKADPKIAGISLYAYQINENAMLPFNPLIDGYAAYFMQVPSSWGQVWSNEQWNKFKMFYNDNPVIGAEDRLPENVKKWPESSWKKYFYKYMVQKDLYFIYPTISLVTNFVDIGTHYGYSVPYYQVPLETRKHRIAYSFVEFKNGFNKYDAYLEILPECLAQYDVEANGNIGMDLYGTKQLTLFDYDYVYSIKECTNPIKSYGIIMSPLLLNLINDIKGNTIHFAGRKSFYPDNEKGRSRIIQHHQLLGYEYGVISGSKTATLNTMKSSSFKVGYNLLHPLSWIKGLFSRQK